MAWSGWDRVFRATTAEEDDQADDASSPAQQNPWASFDPENFLRASLSPGRGEPASSSSATAAAGAQSENIVTDAAPVATKRGRGRPKGTTGSAFLRKAEKEAAEKIARQKAQRDAALRPEPGSIAYAREFRRPLSQQSSGPSVVQPSMATMTMPMATETVDFLQPLSPVWGCLQDLGGSTQQALVLAAHFSANNTDKSAWDSSAVAQVLNLRSAAVMSDRALQALMTKAGHAESRHVARDMAVGVSAAVMGGGMLWGACLQAVRAKIGSCWRGVLFIDKMRYDETPLKVRVEDARQKEVATHAKIMQLEHSWFLLMQEEASKKFFLLKGRVPVTLHVVDRMTGENLVQCIDTVHDTTPDWRGVAGAFDCRLRLAVSWLATALVQAFRHRRNGLFCSFC